MERIKRFIDCAIPIKKCNMRCPYCYITRNKEYDSSFEGFLFPPEHIARALSQERLGGVCQINMCAQGETLIFPEVVDIIKAILGQGHFVSIITNGTISHLIDRLIDISDEFAERIFFKFSLHYLELLRLNLVDRFFENISKVGSKGCSFTVELTPDDSYIPYIDEIKSLCLERVGALCHITEIRDESRTDFRLLSELPPDVHLEHWESFDSELLRFKRSVWEEKREEFCYAGEWTGSLNLVTGDFLQCNRGKLQNIFEDLEEPIHFFASARQCPFPHCYNAHAWQGIGGNIPEIDAPTYEQMRNRVCLDGAQWLSPRVKAFFSTKCSENNEEYDENRRIYTDAVMYAMYGHVRPSEDEELRFPGIVEDYIKRGGYKKIALVGYDNLNELLQGALKDSAVEISEVITAENADVDGAELKESELKKADAVIITNYKEFIQIKKILNDIMEIPLINILDLVKVGETN